MPNLVLLYHFTRPYEEKIYCPGCIHPTGFGISGVVEFSTQKIFQIHGTARLKEEQHVSKRITDQLGLNG